MFFGLAPSMILCATQFFQSNQLKKFQSNQLKSCHRYAV